jgi:ABC transporter, ATP-binding protein
MVLSGVLSILFDVFFIANILDLLISGAAWNKILIACVGGAVLVLFRVVLSKVAVHLSARIYSINKSQINADIYIKSLDYSLKEFCDPEFLDSYKFVIESSTDYINKSLDMMNKMIQSVVLCGIFLAEFHRHDIVLVMLITGMLIMHFLIWNVLLKKQADLQYENKKHLQKSERVCRYYERQYRLKESALDLKNKNLFDYLSSKYIGSLCHLMETQKQAKNRSFIVDLLNPIVTNTFQSLVELVLIYVMFHMGIRSVSEYWELVALFSKMSTLYLLTCIGDLTTVSKHIRAFKAFFNHPAKEKGEISYTHEAPMLEIRDLCFSYKPNDPFRLDKINITVHPGESIAVVGRNGSGKTTFMNLLLGAYMPDSGSISIKNSEHIEIDLSNYSPSMITQDFNIYYTTVRSNITMGESFYTDAEVTAAYKNAECDFLDYMRNPLDTLIGREIYSNGIEMSGGQLQRIALARCFLSDSPLVLLDEPTASIDPIFEKELIGHFLDFISNKTAVIITHRLDITEFVDTIYVMENGKIIESGNFEYLMSRKSFFKDMYNSQKGIGA